MVQKSCDTYSWLLRNCYGYIMKKGRPKPAPFLAINNCILLYYKSLSCKCVVRNHVNEIHT